MADRILTEAEVALVVRAASTRNVLTVPYDASEYVLPDIPSNRWAFDLLAAHAASDGATR